MSNLLNSGLATSGGVQLIGCTVRGPSHEAADRPSQDAWWGHRLTDARFVAAVGDGLGSAERSHTGARLATRETAEALTRHLSGGGIIEGDAMESVMREAFIAARERVEAAAAERDCPVEELHTTLLAVAAGPSGIAAAAVGDGGIVGEADDGPFLLVPREESEYANVTTPVTSARWADGYRFGFHDDVDAVAVFTDGISPFAWDKADPTAPRREFFDQIFDFAAAATDRSEATRDLCAFLNAEHFRTYSGDDKTLAVGRVEPADLGDRLLFGSRIGERLLEACPDAVSSKLRRGRSYGHPE